MKTLLLSLLLGLSFNIGQNDNTTVYISTGNLAVVYHSKISCRTIKRCISEGHVKKITLQEAKEMGRLSCTVCYKSTN